jgi:hypothetical protein
VLDSGRETGRGQPVEQDAGLVERAGPGGQAGGRGVEREIGGVERRRVGDPGDLAEHLLVAAL